VAGLTIGQSETEPLPSPMFEKILVEVNGEGLDPYALAINGPSRWPVYCQRLLLRQSPPKSHSGAAKRKQKVALQNRSERIDLTEFKYCATKLDLPIGRENRIRPTLPIRIAHSFTEVCRRSGSNLSLFNIEHNIIQYLPCVTTQTSLSARMQRSTDHVQVT
jgi:hypothetical protein